MDKVELMALSYDLERSGRNEASALVDFYLNHLDNSDVAIDASGSLCASGVVDSCEECS